MIGLDTNVLVRFIMQDNAKPSAKANKLIASLSTVKPEFIPFIAIVQLVWVLECCFQLTCDHLVQALDALLPTKERVVDRADQVIKALRMFKAGTSRHGTARLILPTVGWSEARQAPVTAGPRRLTSPPPRRPAWR